ncbi:MULTISPECIES: hypothetical protein [unclassified Methylobacterium]|uniref:hypothetical protein n=1 Tax=unclassified Methylobacterium TaxID=2615210 RepID=UPI0037000722
MPTIHLLQNEDGLWAVAAPNLVVTGLTRESAEAFAAAYRRLHERQTPRPA